MAQPNPSDEISVRYRKIERTKEEGGSAFADRFGVTHSLAAAREIPDETESVSVAGRIVSMRSFGKLIFAHLQDADGRLQIALQKNHLGDRFEAYGDRIDVGDHIGVHGPLFTTRTGEKTVRVDEMEFLSKALRPLPDKFHGVADVELSRRRRYLELISDPAAVRRFKLRSQFIRSIREYLNDHGFVEIDTPVLTNKASGALATPFVTRYEALSMDVYLRIAPETYLKRAVAAGFNRVFEIARCFRNEGVDAGHLPDFTMVEFYAAYWNYRDNMDFTESMLKKLIEDTVGSQEIEYKGRSIDFSGEWPRKSYRDLILEDSGVDIATTKTKEDLIAAIEENEIVLGDPAAVSKAGYGTLMDLLYKKVSRPKLVNPTFVVAHPVDMSPLARRNDSDPTVVDRFQLVVNGWEVVNAYSELVDPIDQRRRLEEQAAARAAGDDQAMPLDEDFLLCMEHGMPPMSGWGMGVDRFAALLTSCDNLRDVVLFPLLRPE